MNENILMQHSVDLAIGFYFLFMKSNDGINQKRKCKCFKVYFDKDKRNYNPIWDYRKEKIIGN